MLPGGLLTIYVRDANNCRIDITVEVPNGADIGATLVPALDCPIVDPADGSITQPLAYYVDFNTIGADINNTDVTYILESVNGDPAPIQDASEPTRYIVQPNIAYQGRIEHVLGCIKDLGTITVETYIPLSNLRVMMTNNPRDPNEYEILVDGGSGNSDTYTYFVTYLDGVETELVDNIFSIRETGTYEIRVVDNESGGPCELISLEDLTYINIRIPNFFTPGIDNPNTPEDDSYWYPYQISPDPSDPFFFSNMEVKVFDRYGRLLAEFEGDELGWDGIYQGKELPSGDYWFTIILNDIDNREFTGHFTLYR